MSLVVFLIALAVAGLVAAAVAAPALRRAGMATMNLDVGQ
jgi:hypothetical protein